VNPVEMLDAALELAAEALEHGELPIAAVVFLGDEVVAKAYTQERALNRRIVHAELLALTDADHQLRWQKRDKPMRMAVTLEPCLMCLGAAATLGVSAIYFGLESPGDGAAGIAASWQPEAPDLIGYKMPAVAGGISRARCRALFQRYCDTAPDNGIRRWALTLANPAPPVTPPTAGLAIAAEPGDLASPPDFTGPANPATLGNPAGLAETRQPANPDGPAASAGGLAGAGGRTGAGGLGQPVIPGLAGGGSGRGVPPSSGDSQADPR
jgi:tRNA(adenine34) deaminase